MSSVTKKRILLVLGSSFISLLIVEIMLRIADYPSEVQFGWKNPYFPQEEINELGFRGKRIDYNNEDFVILLLGDSQVSAASLAFDTLPERMLEFHLGKRRKKAKVFTLGTDGYGQDQQLLALREYYRRGYRADLVLLWFTRENDFWNNTFPTHGPGLNAWTKPTFLLRDDELEGPHTSFILGKYLKIFDLPYLSLKQAYPLHEMEFERILPPTTYSYEGEDAGIELSLNSLSPLHVEWEQLEKQKSMLSLFMEPETSRMSYAKELTRKLLQELENTSKANKSEFVALDTVRDYATMKDSMVPFYYVAAHLAESNRATLLHNNRKYNLMGGKLDEYVNYALGSLATIPVAIPLKDSVISNSDPHFNVFANDYAMSKAAAFVEYNYLRQNTNSEVVQTFAEKEVQLKDHQPADVMLYGFSKKEEWGRWTDGPKAQVMFQATSSGPFFLILEAQFFGQNSFENMQVLYGDEPATLVRATQERAVYRFSVGESHNVFSFGIANPQSPENLGLSTDPRKLGMGLKSVKTYPFLKQFAEGWHEQETTGRWSAGNGVLQIERPTTESESTVSIKVNAGPIPTTLGLLLDGKQVQTITLKPSEDRIVNVVIPPGPRNVDIRLRSSTFVPKEIQMNTDERTLGIYVRSSELE